MKKFGNLESGSFGCNMLCQAAGDDHGEWSKNKEHVWHKKTVHMEGPYGEADVEVECLYCDDPDHWAYVYPTGGGYGYADWDGDGYADNGDAPYGYEWYTYYRTVYYDIWVDPDEYGNDGSGGLPYGGSSGYPTEGSDGFNTISNVERVIIKASPLYEREYSKILDDFDNSNESRVLAPYLKDRVISIEYDPVKTNGGAGLYEPETDTIYLGPGADDKTLMREMLHAVDVQYQNSKYPGNAEVAELLFGREMEYDSGDKYKDVLNEFKAEMDRVIGLEVPENERMKHFSPTIWQKLVDLRKEKWPYSTMTFDKDSFNPWPALNLSYELNMLKDGKVRKTVKTREPVRVLRKPYPKN